MGFLIAKRYVKALSLSTVIGIPLIEQVGNAPRSLPGMLERMGFAPGRLLQIKPRRVIVRVSGWGQTGPYRDKPGFGTLVEAMSGYADINGFADSPPCLPPLATADMVAGLYAAVGLLAALRTVEVGRGAGQVVDISLFERIFSLISVSAAQYRLTGEPMRRNGNQSSHAAPRNIHACADGRYVALSGSMQSMAERIFGTIGRRDLIDDPRFRTNDDRLANRDVLDAIIGAFIAECSREENLALFDGAGVTVGPVCSVAEPVDHPYVVGREIVIEPALTRSAFTAGRRPCPTNVHYGYFRLRRLSRLVQIMTHRNKSQACSVACRAHPGFPSAPGDFARTTEMEETRGTIV